MRKNLLVAALVGFCVMGLAACSKGENKPSDTTTTAMTTEQAPAQVADAANEVNAAQPEASQQVADSNQAATPEEQTSAPMTTAEAAPSTMGSSAAAPAPSTMGSSATMGSGAAMGSSASAPSSN